jgi:hypothetical protein
MRGVLAACNEEGGSRGTRYASWDHASELEASDK